MFDKQEIKDQLRSDDGEEFDFNGDIASINAVAEGQSHVEIGHFVVRKKDRREGYGSTLFEALIEVLREEGYHSATVRIQAVEDGSKSDPVMRFLEDYGFEHNKSFEHYNWGTCIEAYGHF